MRQGMRQAAEAPVLLKRYAEEFDGTERHQERICLAGGLVHHQEPICLAGELVHTLADARSDCQRTARRASRMLRQ